MDLFLPAIPSMNDFFKTTPAVMQASLYVFMLTVGLGQLCVGSLADVFGRRRVALCAAGLFLLGSLISALAQSISILILARMIQAAGACGTYLVCFVVVRDNFSTSVCARLFSVLCATNAMVASSAPVIGGFLMDTTEDWRSTFYFLAMLGVLMVATAWLTIPHYPVPKQERSLKKTGAVYQCALNNDAFRQYTLVACTCLLGLYLFCAFSSGILISQLGLSGTQYGFWFGLNALTVFVANMTAARLTYDYPLSKIVNWGLLGIACSSVLMISFNLDQVSVLGFMVPMLCMTFGIGLSMGSAAALALSDFKEQAANATALLGACQYLMSGLIGLITAQWVPSPCILALPMLSLSVFLWMSTKNTQTQNA
jgi:DHA1 family bicyclomycin/chloramphenicol resistance-like MFS transporter